MRNLFTRLTLIVMATTSFAYAAPAPAPAPATQPRPTTGEYDAGFGPTKIKIPGGGVLLLDGRPATERAAFLGVSVAVVSPELREQLKLRRGVGLLVNHVEADSPAEAAGVKRFDVLERLDDQILIEPRQLSVLIRLHQAGDEVKLTLVREAKPQTVAAKLAEKDLPSLDDALLPSPPRIWRTYPSQRGSADPFSAEPVRASQFGIAWSDGELSIDLLHDQGRRLVARNKAGDVIFEGSIDTPEQLQRLPEIVKTKAMKVIGMSTTQPSSALSPSTQPLHFRSTLKPPKIAPPRPPAPAGEPAASPAM
jgi:hypothetical protein